MGGMPRMLPPTFSEISPIKSLNSLSLKKALLRLLGEGVFVTGGGREREERERERIQLVKRG